MSGFACLSCVIPWVRRLRSVLRVLFEGSLPSQQVAMTQIKSCWLGCSGGRVVAVRSGAGTARAAAATSAVQERLASSGAVLRASRRVG